MQGAGRVKNRMFAEAEKQNEEIKNVSKRENERERAEWIAYKEKFVKLVCWKKSYFWKTARW